MVSFLVQPIFLTVFIINCIDLLVGDNPRCIDSLTKLNRLQFSLVRSCQRSSQDIIELENTQSLEECFTLAKRVKGLALNYAPLTRHSVGNQHEKPRQSYQARRSHFWQQAEEFFNCHVLQCPENATFKTLVNDSRFDYYSLYGEAPDSKNYSCISEVGLFQLNTVKTNYNNAFNSCLNKKALLAHVASPERTHALTKLLMSYNERIRLQRYDVGYSASIHLAYVGLHMNRTTSETSSDFLTPHNESLKCFLYRSWAPGHPRVGGSFQNTSCVAISTTYTWVTVGCEQELPFICEVSTSMQLNHSWYYLSYRNVARNTSNDECGITAN